MSDARRSLRSVRWAARLFTVLVVPALVLCAAELALRLAGYGHATSYFLTAGDEVRTNPRFGWRFFGPELSRPPLPTVLAKHKPQGTVRIFVLGGSAARGFPDPAFSLAPMLKAMLEDKHPNTRFEVVNTGMTAINSHVVREILDDCLALQPDLFVVYLGNNEVVGPFGAGTVFGGGLASERAIRLGLWVRSTRLGQLLADLRHRWAAPDETTRREWGGMGMFVDQKVPADHPRLQMVYANFRANLQAMLTAARRHHVPIVFSTVLANAVDQPPFFSVEGDLGATTRERWQRDVEDGEAFAIANEWERAQEKLAEAVELDPGHARSHWELGRALAALQRQDEADAELRKALELDALRFRADARINEVIRDVASAPGATLADPYAGRRSLCGHDVLLEHVHLNFEGTHAVASAMLTALEPHLPAPVRGQRTPGPIASTARCAARLVFDDFAELVVEQQIAAITARPPFDAEAAEPHRRRAADLAAGLRPRSLQQSAAALSQALARDPQDLARRSHYADLLAFLGRPDEALAQIDQLLERIPGDAYWRLRKAELASAAGHHAEAVAQLEELVRDEPYFAEARPALAAAEAVAGDREGARREYQTTAQLYPHNADVHYQLGKMAFEDEDYPQAQRQLQLATQYDPAHAEAWYLRGRLLDRDHRLEPALVAYARAREALPGRAPAYYYAARATFRLGAIDAARELYRQAVEYDPRYGQPPYRLAAAIDRDDAASGMVAELQAMVAAAPEDARLHVDLGLAYSFHSRPDLAIGEMRRAVALDDTLEEAWDRLALLAAAGADSTVSPAEVVAWAERACQLSQDENAGRLDTLALAKARAGDVQGALTAARKGLVIARRLGPAEQVQRLRARIGELTHPPPGRS